MASKQLLIGTFSPSRQKSCLTVDGRRQPRLEKTRKRPKSGDNRRSGNKFKGLRDRVVRRCVAKTSGTLKTSVYFFTQSSFAHSKTSVLSMRHCEISPKTYRGAKKVALIKRKPILGNFLGLRKEPKKFPRQQFWVKIVHTDISFCELCCH